MDLVIATPLGLVIGSFLNVVAYRLPRGESLVWPGSHCTSCGADIKPWDNVPLLSWIVLRGRCRGCSQSISARYPLVELVTALVFAAVVLSDGISSELWLTLPFAALMVVLAAIDIDHRIVPNKLVLPAAVYGLAVGAAVRLDDLPELAIAGAGAFTFMLIAALAYPAGMGMGDVKLAGVMGLYLGLSVVPALLIAFALGSLVGLAMIARHGAAARKRGVPFVPFMAAGALAGLLFGPALIDLYVENFL
jgi:leader peptidase (prepilin peptidase) / N-methyltransferase